MPLYEYHCAKDGTFEQVRKFSDPPLEKCPTCGGPVEKLLSAPAIQFKGSGWYITDYARKGDGAAGKKEGAGSEKSSGSSDKQTGSSSEKAGSSSSSSSGSDSKPASSSGSGDKK